MKKDFKGKKILVFGGLGFIGSNFVRYILNNYEDVEVTVVDKLTYSGNLDNLKEFELEQAFDTNHRISKDRRLSVFIGWDIADPQVVETSLVAKPDYVINFAAETHVDRSIHVGAKQFIDSNIVGVFNILEAVREHPVTKFVQVSTDEVYGQLLNPYDEKSDVDREIVKNLLKFTEHNSLSPNSPYSASKASGDCLCLAYHATWGVPVVITRSSNNYGPYQYPEKMVPFWVSKLLKRERIPIYGDGLNIRDWIHVDDHVKALVLCLLKGRTGEIYNIGADNEKTNLEMAQIITDYVKRDLVGIYAPNLEDSYEFVKDRPGHDRRYAINSVKIRGELGWKPEVTSKEFVHALQDTISWYYNNQDWVENILKGKGEINKHIKQDEERGRKA